MSAAPAAAPHGPAAVPSAAPGPLPARADAVVIGGGVIGVSAALFLAARGLRTVLIEKGRIGAEQSSRNWGWVRAQGRDAAEMPIMLESHRLWQELDAEAGGATGLRRRGVLYLAPTPAKMAAYERWLPVARAHRLDSRLIGPAEVAALLPGAARRFEGALWTPSDARAEPAAAMAALARLAAARGATLIEGCAARCLDLAAGRVAGVVTEQGRIAADAVVLAGGAWSALFLRNHGVTIPQLSVLCTVAATAPLPEVFAGCATDRTLAFRRRQDGGYTLAFAGAQEVPVGPDALRHLRLFWPQLRAAPFANRYLPWAPRGFPDAWGTPRRWSGAETSPFERMRILDPRPHPRLPGRLAAGFAALFPALPPVSIARAWAGMIDTMPDIVPVVDAVPALPGLVLATGMSGHGFGIGPGMGRVVADLVAGRPVGHDLARFRFDRFRPGAALVPGPTF